MGFCCIKLPMRVESDFAVKRLWIRLSYGMPSDLILAVFEGCAHANCYVSWRVLTGRTRRWGGAELPFWI